MTNSIPDNGFRELDRRTGDGINVRLLWNSVADEVVVAVHDTRSDESFEFQVAAADTVMKRPSRELMSEVFPGVPVADRVSGHDTLLDIAKARRILGYSPTFSWRELF